MPKTVATEPVVNAPAVEETAADANEPIVSQEIVETSSVYVPSELVEFLEEWAKSVKGYEPEVVGTFVYHCRQNHYYVNTPSGWLDKFTRWIASN